MADPGQRLAARFITFYSFKGGVGRSMALINVASNVARRGFRVLVIDFDLEAPGLSYLIREQRGSAATAEQPGLIDLLSDAIQRGPDSDLFAQPAAAVVQRYSFPYVLPSGMKQRPGGALRIMPAGRLKDDYQRHLDELDLPELYRSGRGQPLIQALKQVIQASQEAEFIFIDSRTGFSDEAGICTRDLADHLIIVSGLNHQNVTGTAAFLAALRGATEGKKSVQFVLSPVPNGEDELVDQRERAAKVAFQEAWGSRVRLNHHIPYHPRLALTEEPHIFRRSRGYLFDAYIALEKEMLKQLQFDASGLSRLAAEDLEAGRFAIALERLTVAARLPDSARALESVAAFSIGNDLLEKAEAKSMIDFLIAELSPRSMTLKHWASRLGKIKDNRADLIYQRILAEMPRDSGTLNDYANFLTDVRGQHDDAEDLYRKALELATNNADILGNYAIFLTNVRGQHDGAETLYWKAIELAPWNANLLGNLAQLVLAQGRLQEGQALIKQSFNGKGLEPPLMVELNFYSYAHLWQEDPLALSRLMGLLLSGVRSKGWPLQLNLARAQQQGHPELGLLTALADVISRDAPIESLNAFPLWRETTPGSAPPH